MESQWHNVVTVCGNSLSFLTWTSFLNIFFFCCNHIGLNLGSDPCNKILLLTATKISTKFALTQEQWCWGDLSPPMAAVTFFQTTSYMWQDFVKWTCCQTCFSLNFPFEWLELVMMIILVNCYECHLLKIV